MLVANKMHDVMCTDERKQKGVSEFVQASEMGIGVVVMEARVCVSVIEVVVLVTVVVKTITGGTQHVAMSLPLKVLPLFTVAVASALQFTSFVAKVLPVHMPLTQGALVHLHVHVQANSSTWPPTAFSICVS